jgi:23S rRNA maturation mini-RNase III
MAFECLCPAESDLNVRTVELASELCMDRVHRLVAERVSYKMEAELPAMAQGMLKDSIRDALARGRHTVVCTAVEVG